MNAIVCIDVAARGGLKDDRHQGGGKRKVLRRKAIRATGPPSSDPYIVVITTIAIGTTLQEIQVPGHPV